MQFAQASAPWLQFALTVLDRLHQAPPAEAQRQDANTDAPSDLDWLSAPNPGKTSPLKDALDKHAATEPAVNATAERAAAQAPTQPSRAAWPRLAAGIRLAALFGTADAITEATAAGAITLIDTIPSADLDHVRDALERGLLPQNISCFREPPPTELEDFAVVLCPRISTSGETSHNDTNIFWRAVDAALKLDTPLILLLPTGLQLPVEYATALPSARPLPRLDQSMLGLLLLLLYDNAREISDAPIEANAGVDAVIAALPDERALARLTRTQLQIALRRPTAQAAAKYLRDGLVLPTSNEPRLEDLVGLGDAKDVALGIVEDLARWRLGQLRWADVPRGILLSGAPGTGKTMLARVMAASGDFNFVSASYADWQAHGHLGDFLRALNETFDEARAGAPSVLFLDELDAFTSRMAGSARERSYDTKAIAGLLQALDGIQSREGVVVIAATNHPQLIDPAIVRAGRFDRHIQISPPSPADLSYILRQHLRADLPRVTLDDLAGAAAGATGADAAAAVRNARARARAARRPMTESDLKRELLGDFTCLPASTRQRAAIHEGGHAIVAAALRIADPIALRLGPKGGECITRPRPHGMTAADLERLQAQTLAGRAAERLILSAVSAGAGGSAESDLAKATCRALQAELSFGLGQAGAVWIAEAPEPKDLFNLPAAVRRAVELGLARAESTATDILRENRDLLIELATRLEKTGVTAGGDLKTVLKKVRAAATAATDTAFPPNGAGVADDGIPASEPSDCAP